MHPAPAIMLEVASSTVARGSLNSAPKGTAKEIVQKVGAETARALKEPQVRQRIISAGMEPSEGSTPENFSVYLREEVARWRQRVQDAGLKAE